MLAGLLCTPAMADDYWPRSYFVEAGWGLAYSTGDLNSTTVEAKDTLDRAISIYMPDLGLMTHPDLTIGANIWAFTLAANFTYWKSKVKLAEYEDSHKLNSRMWRFGFEFTYNLFYPDNLQIGLGGGYSYANIKTQKSAMDSHGDAEEAEIMGSGLAFIANVRYFFTKNLILAPTFKIYGNWFKNAYAPSTELQDVKPYMWQTFIFGAISFQYQF
ncbi:MAG: hypothetical protein MJY93_07020 [Fibrobacter sp.]|nr:hypothetical protein [Fibrobacter sp.]